MGFSKQLTAGALAVLLLAVAAPTAGAEIVFDRGDDLWAMNDDGSNQHLIVNSFSVPDVDDASHPGVDPNGTSLVFQAEWTDFCARGCVGIYSIVGGVMRRISEAGALCPGGFFCSTYNAEPAIAPDGEVFFEYGYEDTYAYTTFLNRQSSLGGAKTDIPHACGSNDPDHVAVSPVGDDLIAYACPSISSGSQALYLAERDGTDATAYFNDDANVGSVAFSPDGNQLVTSEGGLDAGIWKYELFAPVFTPTHVLGAPSGTQFTTARKISGNRIAFVALPEANIWTIPASCTSATCTFPGSATRLTNAGLDRSLTWTARTVTLPGGGGGPGSDACKKANRTLAARQRVLRRLKARSAGRRVIARQKQKIKKARGAKTKACK